MTPGRLAGRLDGGHLRFGTIRRRRPVLLGRRRGHPDPRRGHRRINEEDTDTVVRYADPGAPGADYPHAYNDLRGIPSRTLLLTPQNIRRIAEIRLALRRLDRHLARVNADPQYAADAQTSDLTLGRIAIVANLIQLLMGELGYGI